MFDHVCHDDIIKWKHFPRHGPFVRGIHRSPVNSPYISQWRGALMFSLVCAWIYRWVNNREAGDLRRHRVHYDVTAIYTLNYFHNVTVSSTKSLNVHRLQCYCSLKTNVWDFDCFKELLRAETNMICFYFKTRFAPLHSTIQTPDITDCLRRLTVIHIHNELSNMTCPIALLREHTQHDSVIRNKLFIMIRRQIIYLSCTGRTAILESLF